MSTTEELKSELSKVNKSISDRINKANELKLPGKISEVAVNYGKIDDFNGSRHFFTEKGLSISFGSSYIKVDLGHGTENVFEANLQQNGVGEIHLYIPGDWEKRIEELYLEIPERQRKKEVSLLLNEIDLLKKKWKLGEDS